MYRVLLPLFVLVIGCGGTTPATPVVAVAMTQDIPMVYDRAILSQPIDAASQEAQQLWRLYERRPPAPTAAEWTEDMSKTFVPWLRDYTKTIKDMQPSVSVLAKGLPADRLFASVVLAATYDSLVTTIREMPSPKDLSEELKRTFRSALNEQAFAVTRQLPNYWQACADSAEHLSLPLADWKVECSARKQKYEQWAQEVTASQKKKSQEVASRQPKPQRKQKTIRWPSQCTEGYAYRMTPLAEAPNTSEPMELAVVLPESLDGLTGRERQRFIDKAAKRLGKDLGAQPISSRKIRAAETLHAQRRLKKRGLVCGVAPSIEDILSQDHPHLVVAYPNVESWNGKMALTVYVSRPGDKQGMGHWSTPISNDTPKDLTEAAGKFTKGRAGGLLSVLGALASGGFSLRTLRDAEESPWLGVSTRMSSKPVRQALQACSKQHGVYAFNVKFDVAANGSTSNLSLQTSASPDGVNAPELVACVESALTQLSLPCTRSGQTESVDVTLCMKSQVGQSLSDIFGSKPKARGGLRAN